MGTIQRKTTTETQMMNTKDFQFGVEIEFANAMTNDVARRLNAALSGYGMEVQLERYGHRTRNYWKVTTDATVSRRYDLRTGVGEGGEVVSPILHGIDGFKQLKRILDAMADIPDLTVDRRCGIQVHLSWDGMDRDWVANVVRRYAHHEDAIDGWMSRSRRDNNSRWCRSVQPVIRQIDDLIEYNCSMLSLARTDRYRKVNLQSLNSHGTVEFRQHQGSTNYQKVANWVRFLMAFVDQSREYQHSATTSFIPRHFVRGESRRAYGAIRFQIEQLGGSMHYAGGRNWKVLNRDGDVIHRVSNNALDNCYDGRRLNRLGMQFLSAMAELMAPEAADADDDLFAGVPTNTVTFLNQRAEALAA